VVVNSVDPTHEIHELSRRVRPQKADERLPFGHGEPCRLVRTPPRRITEAGMPQQVILVGVRREPADDAQPAMVDLRRKVVQLIREPCGVDQERRPTTRHDGRVRRHLATCGDEHAGGDLLQLRHPVHPSS